MLQNTLNIFLDIYYICVFENKTKKLCPGCVETWKISTIALITCQVHDPILFFGENFILWENSF